MDPVSLAIIVALIGGTINAIDYNNKANGQVDRLGQEKKDKQAEYNEAVDRLKLAYELAEIGDKNAANRADSASTNHESWLTDAYNNQMKGLSAQIEQAGFQNQMMAIQGDQAVEGARAELGASGVRGGATSYQALEQQNAINDRALALNTQSIQNQTESALINAYASLNGNMEEIGTARYQAASARNRYTAGGDAYETKEQQSEHMANAWQRTASAYDQAIEDARPDFWGGMSAFFGGAAQGVSMATNIAQFGDNFSDMFQKASITTPTMKAINTNYSGIYSV